MQKLCARTIKNQSHVGDVKDRVAKRALSISTECFRVILKFELRTISQHSPI